MAAYVFDNNGGAGDSNWGTTTNWEPEGTPGSADDVTIAAAVTSLVTTGATRTCKTFNATGAGGGGTFTLSGTGTIYAYGNVTFDANTRVTVTGAIYFLTNAATFITANQDLSSLSTLLISLGCDLTLSGNINAGSKPLYVYGAGSSLDTQNYSITCGVFGDAGQSGAITLTLSSSTITCTSVSFATTTLTVTSTNHTINISSNSATANNFGGKSWGIVNFKSNASAAIAHAITFGTGATFVQFNIDQLTDRRDCSVSFSGNFSCSQSSTWKSGGAGNDDPTYRLLIKSSAVGTARTLTYTAGSQTHTITDVDLQDIVVSTTNTPTITGTRVGDCGGNTNCDVDAQKTVYLDFGTANANYYSLCWATSSGGGDVSNNNYPLQQDIAVIDNNSWDDTGNTLTLNDLLRIGNINASALTEAQTIILQSATYYGDLNLSGTGVTVTSTSDTVTLDARTATTLSLTADGTDSWGSGAITIASYGGTVQLASAITHTGTFTHTQGTLDLNGQTLTTNILSSSNTNTRTLQDTAGGGKIVLNALTGTALDFSTDTNLTVSNAPDIDVGDSNNTLTAAVTLALGSTAKTLGDIAFKKHAGNFAYIVTGVGHTLGAVTQETPDATYQYNSVTWPASETANIVGSYNVTGHVDYDCYIQSSSGGSPAHLSDSAGTNTFSYCTIQDMHVLGGAVWDADDGTDTDVSGNDGWTWPGGASVVGSRMILNDIFPVIQMFKGATL